MRVLMWTESFRPAIGGVEVFVECLARSLRERGHDVTVVTNHRDPGLPDEDELDGVPVVRVPFYAALASGRPEAIAHVRHQVADLKRRLRIDLVHVHTMSASVLFHLESARAWPAPALLTMHGGPELPHRGGETATLAHRLFERAAWICCCSRAVRAQLVAAEGPLARDRSSVVYCGIKEPAIAPVPRPIAQPRLLCLGRLVDLKGFDVALAAFARVGARWPAARLIVAGDGPARRQLEAQAVALGVSGAVDFVGWVEAGKTAALINTATAVIVPSRRESLGLVAVEAGLLERPVVATSVEGLPEAVEHGVTGLLVAPDDSAVLADAIGVLLERPDMADAMGRAGRRHARARFSWTRTVDEYDARYRQVTEETAHDRTGRTLAAE